MVSAQVAVTELVLRLIDRRHGLLHGRGGGFQVGLGGVELRLGADATVEQFLLAPGVGLRVDELCLHLGQIALRRTQLVLLIGGVEVGQNIALFDHRAHVVIPPHNAPRHTKAQRAFVAGFDRAGKAAEVFRQLGLDHHEQRGAHRLGGFFFRATDQQGGRQGHHPQRLHS